MKKKCRKLVLAGLVLGLMLGCTSMKAGNYGSIAPDDSIEKSFLAGTLKPGLTYYYLSSEDSPYVIIGVDKSLVLDDAREWRLMEPQSSGRLRRVVQSSYDVWRAQGYTFRGFKMLDQNGRYVGDWFSIWDMGIIHPVLYSKDGDKILIYPPPFPRLESGPAGNERNHK